MQLWAYAIEWEPMLESLRDEGFEEWLEERLDDEDTGPWPSDSYIRYFTIAEGYPLIRERLSPEQRIVADEWFATLFSGDGRMPMDVEHPTLTEYSVMGAFSPATVRRLRDMLGRIDVAALDRLYAAIPRNRPGESPNPELASYFDQWRAMFDFAIERGRGMLVDLD